MLSEVGDQYNILLVSWSTMCVCRSTLQIELEDHIVLKGEKTGIVKYVGHLDNTGQTNMVFVGVELDAPGNPSCLISLFHIISIC